MSYFHNTTWAEKLIKNSAPVETCGITLIAITTLISLNNNNRNNNNNNYNNNSDAIRKWEDCIDNKVTGL